MTYQANAEDLEDADPSDRAKFVVGARLRFVRHDDDIRSRFRVGEHLRVLERNGCGMGIDVMSETTGLKDMVWPSEVKLVPKSGKKPTIPR